RSLLWLRVELAKLVRERLRHPAAVLAPAEVEGLLDRGVPGLERQESHDRVARTLVVRDEVPHGTPDVAGRGRTLRVDLGRERADGLREQPLLAPEAADHRLDGDAGVLGDAVEGDLVVPLGHQPREERLDDPPGGVLGGAGPRVLRVPAGRRLAFHVSDTNTNYRGVKPRDLRTGRPRRRTKKPRGPP